MGPVEELSLRKISCPRSLVPNRCWAEGRDKGAHLVGIVARMGANTPTNRIMSRIKVPP